MADKKLSIKILANKNVLFPFCRTSRQHLMRLLQLLLLLLPLLERNSIYVVKKIVHFEKK